MVSIQNMYIIVNQSYQGFFPLWTQVKKDISGGTS